MLVFKEHSKQYEKKWKIKATQQRATHLNNSLLIVEKLLTIWSNKNQILCYLFPLCVIVRVQQQQQPQHWNTWYKKLAIFACSKVICAQILAQGHRQCKNRFVLCLNLGARIFIPFNLPSRCVMVIELCGDDEIEARIMIL